MHYKTRSDVEQLVVHEVSFPRVGGSTPPITHFLNFFCVEYSMHIWQDNFFKIN